MSRKSRSSPGSARPSFASRGDAPLLVVNDRLNINLPTDGAHTAGGLLLNKLGRLPEVGDEIELDEVRLRVEAVVERAVEEVLLTLKSSNTVVDEEELS